MNILLNRTIWQATSDIKIPIIFNNAGYIVTGFFDQTNIDSQLANMVRICHLSTFKYRIIVVHDTVDV